MTNVPELFQRYAERLPAKRVMIATMTALTPSRRGCYAWRVRSAKGREGLPARFFMPRFRFARGLTGWGMLQSIADVAVVKGGPVGYTR